MAYILKRQPVRNLGRVIRFALDGEEMVRQLVMTAHDIAHEISVASPVGMRLANAEQDKEFIVPLPGDEFIVVKVLAIQDSLAPAAA